MKLKIYHIDAFTDTVFKGNYAAVIVIDEWLSKDLMQSIATENNLSETAFVKRNNTGKYEIRWFSPLTEIDFCGHATLASAFVLFEQDSSIRELIFSTEAVGDLRVRQMEDGYIEMTFPVRMPEPVMEIPSELVNGLSIKPVEVLRNQQAYFVIYQNEKDVYSVEINTEELKNLDPYDVVVTSKSSVYDFISRYFWPANGTAEDPVTGSIHAGLVPFWAERLGKNELRAYQASDRGGLLICRLHDNEVLVSGKAVQYMEGFIEIQ
jgi:PhzF family phenazine biosynthesis protein